MRVTEKNGLFNVYALVHCGPREIGLNFGLCNFNSYIPPSQRFGMFNCVIEQESFEEVWSESEQYCFIILLV